MDKLGLWKPGLTPAVSPQELYKKWGKPWEMRHDSGPGTEGDVTTLRSGEEPGREGDWQGSGPEKSQAGTEMWHDSGPEKSQAVREMWQGSGPEKSQAGRVMWHGSGPEKSQAVREMWQGSGPEKSQAGRVMWYDSGPEKCQAVSRHAVLSAAWQIIWNVPWDFLFIDIRPSEPHSFHDYPPPRSQQMGTGLYGEAASWTWWLCVDIWHRNSNLEDCKTFPAGWLLQATKGNGQVLSPDDYPEPSMRASVPTGATKESLQDLGAVRARNHRQLNTMEVPGLLFCACSHGTLGHHTEQAVWP